MMDLTNYRGVDEQRVLKFIENYKSIIICDSDTIYWYDENAPNFGKRCNAKGCKVEVNDILNFK